MADKQSIILHPPFLGHPIEICIVTPNLHQTLQGFCNLGIGPFKIYPFTPQTVSEQTFRFQPTPFSLKVAFAEQSGMIWEVMQPVSGPSLMREFLDQTGGKGGIHHVAFDCKDGEGVGVPLVGEQARMDAKRGREDFERRGFECVQSGVWRGKKGTCEFMFFDTEGAIGTCFESYAFSDDWEDPDEVEHFPPKQE